MNHRSLLVLALVACADKPAADDVVDSDVVDSDVAVDTTVVEGACVVPEGGPTPEFLQQIACTDDFLALASLPIDNTLPGARSGKVVLDRLGGDAIYFQDSVTYPVHYDFVSTHLSGGELPIVPSLSEFNTTEYFSPDRRFILGAVTRYEAAGVWALELSPYDTASADQITHLYERVAESAFFGPALRFHPTSEAVSAVAAALPASVPTVTTDEIYDGIAFQPLSLGEAIGRLHFTTVSDLQTEYISFEDILVLDEAPNDISVVQGLITQEFQTPLSHVNVLSQNRRTPNMGLRGAMTDPTLRALEGELVHLVVTSDAWTVELSTEEEATAFWAAHQPEPVVLPPLDLGVTAIADIADVTPEPGPDGDLRDNIKEAARSYGGKAAHYSVLVRTDDVPIREAFAVPVYYYDQFMRENGFFARVDTLLADPSFTTDASVRDAALQTLRDDMMLAPVNQGFQDLLRAKIDGDPAFAGKKMRFRTSTNSEDLDGFPCAGCYESHSGDPADWPDVLDAIRETYASAWLFRTFEERTYYSVDHDSVGMALLVHANFPDEEANGVAVTSNPYDATGVDPAFYVNVQFGGDAEVVAPPPGVTSDSLLYYFFEPNQPTSYLSHSNLVAVGTTVLSSDQLHQLGVALNAIHERFSPAYGPASGNQGWYAMDVEFKFDNDEAPDQPATLYIKQARPYPGRGE